MRAAAAVMAAGALGAAARCAVGAVLEPAQADGFPWATLTANLTGCLLLGLLAGSAASRGALTPLWRDAAGTGFIGSFTTYSAFSVETVNLARSGHGSTAFIYAALSMTAGFALAWLGLVLGRRTKGAVSP